MFTIHTVNTHTQTGATFHSRFLQDIVNCYIPNMRDRSTSRDGSTRKNYNTLKRPPTPPLKFEDREYVEIGRSLRRVRFDLILKSDERYGR